MSVQVFTLDEYAALREQVAASPRRASREFLDAVQYVVDYDEPDEGGFYGRRLECIFSVVGDRHGVAREAVEARFMELHPRAIDVRVSYA